MGFAQNSFPLLIVLFPIFLPGQHGGQPAACGDLTLHLREENKAAVILQFVSNESPTANIISDNFRSLADACRKKTSKTLPQEKALTTKKNRE